MLTLPVLIVDSRPERLRRSEDLRLAAVFFDISSGSGASAGSLIGGSLGDDPPNPGNLMGFSLNIYIIDMALSPSTEY